MAYDKKKIYQQALDAIDKHKLFFIDDIIAFIPCTKQTFYQFFPLESDELDEIKRKMEINRIEVKSSMRNKWYKSDAPALQMALMKLICTDEERKKLAMSYTENEVNLKTDISELKLPKFMQKKGKP